MPERSSGRSRRYNSTIVTRRERGNHAATAGVLASEPRAGAHAQRDPAGRPLPTGAIAATASRLCHGDEQQGRNRTVSVVNFGSRR